VKERFTQNVYELYFLLNFFIALLQGFIEIRAIEVQLRLKMKR